MSGATRRAMTGTTLAILVAGALVAPATGASSPVAGQPGPAARAATSYGPPVVSQTWAVPTGDAGLSEANQGPYYGNGGIVSWRGALWFTEENAFKLGRIDPATGAITETPVPPAFGIAPYGPHALSASRDDQLWFVLDGQALEGRVGTLAADLSTFEGVNTGYSRQQTVAADPAGGAWTIDPYGEGIQRWDLVNGELGETYFENATYFDGQLTMGPDGNAWVSDGSGVLKRITKAGSIANFPATGGTESDITSLTSSSGHVWYAKFNPGMAIGGIPSTGGIIGKMTPEGIPTPFPAPVQDLIPASLTPGADGNVWFTTGHGVGIGRITPTGAYQLASMPEGHSADSIAFGPDGHLWYVDATLNRVGRILVADFEKAIAGSPPPQPPQPPTPPSVTPKASLVGKVVKVRQGKAVVKVTCAGTAGTECRGRVTISKKGKTKPLAKGTIRLPAGKTGPVKIKLTRAGKAAQRRAARTKVKVRIAVTGGQTTTRSAVLKR